MGVVETLVTREHLLDDPTHAMWGGGPLPEWVSEFHPHQKDAVLEICEEYDRGADVVFLSAPTGSGKTLIAEAVRRLMHWPRALYVCSSLTLQDQFLRDFQYAKLLKGRKNYPTQIMPFPGYTTADCTKTKSENGNWKCDWCVEVGECPYEIAKYEALSSRLAVVNSAYFLAEANFVGSWTRDNAMAPSVIVDEADTAEDALLHHVTYSIAPYQLKHLNIDAPIKGAHVKSILTWMQRELIPAVEGQVAKHSGMDADSKKSKQKWSRLLRASREFGVELAGGGWVRDNTQVFSFKPVTVNKYGPAKLWKHGDKWLLMSATIISATEMAQSLGVVAPYATVNVPMTFDVEKRKVHVAPIANMVAAEKDQAWPRMAQAITTLLLRHADERVLVHSVSYQLTEFLVQELQRAFPRRDIVSYTRASEREEAIDRYRSRRGAVLVAPSLDRGVDFKGEDCRVVIVAKVPFPNLGDRQISERVHSPGGQLWYVTQTVRSLVQMTGRAVRSKDDYCTSYILDSQFTRNVWKKNKELLPKWWSEAIEWVSFPEKTLLTKGNR